MFDDVDLLAPANDDHPLTRNLSSWWVGMPNTGGSKRYYDLRGRNHGTFVNSTLRTSNGNTQMQAVSCNSASSDGVQMDTLVSLASPFAFGMWVYPTGTTANACIAGNYDGGNHWILRQAATDGDDWEFSRNAENGFLQSTSNAVVTNTWQLVLATWDGTNWALYKNAASIATNSNATGPSNGSQTYFGRLPSGFAWSGLIGAVFHYARFFTQADAFALWRECAEAFPGMLNRRKRRRRFAPIAAVGNPWNYYAQAG